MLAASTFDLRFCYILAGWKGLAHNGRVLKSTLAQDFKVLEGKYYLADAGYGLTNRFLTPYKGVRYHFKEKFLAG